MAINRAVRPAIFILIVLQIFVKGMNAEEDEDAKRNERAVEYSHFFFQQSEYPRDCYELHDRCSSTLSSGVYVIKADGFPHPFEVICDSTTDSEGWTVIQRRHTNGTVDFNRNWDSYKLGFGFLSHDFWIGNERLSYLTNQKQYQLVIEMTTSYGLASNQTYDNFRIGDEFSSYNLLGANLQPHSVDHILWCPNNMIYGNCTCSQRRCENPALCEDTCTGDLTEGCICPEGYYMQGKDCVPENQCSCYLLEEQVLIPENATHAIDNCAAVFLCANGEVIRSDSYQCNENALCGERDGLRTCYCKEGYSGDGLVCELDFVGTDCQEIYNAGYTTDGIYSIRPTNWEEEPFEVSCNMTEDGEGWTVFQRRINGSVDFVLDWVNYTQGFGSVDQDHWLGNVKIYYLTNQRNYELRIDMVYKDGNPYYSNYASFRISNEENNFQLTRLGTQSGNSGYNGLSGALNKQFTTRDRDNDVWGDHTYNCAD